MVIPYHNHNWRWKFFILQTFQINRHEDGAERGEEDKTFINPFLDLFRPNILDPENPEHAYLFNKKIYGYADVLQSIKEQMFFSRMPHRGQPYLQAENNCAIMLFGVTFATSLKFLVK